MHQLKVLILGPASFSITLNELKPFLKFNSVKEKNSSDLDVNGCCNRYRIFK